VHLKPVLSRPPVRIEHVPDRSPRGTTQMILNDYRQPTRYAECNAVEIETFAVGPVWRAAPPES
jgi:hypothetical protein